MRIRDNKGSITVFVLVGLLFMTGFLIISFGSNINKSKNAKEQLNILSSIYSYGDMDLDAYERAYTAIRKKNAQILTQTIENSSSLELNKTFTDTFSNYKIYGNSEQNGTPSISNLVEIESVGDYDETTGKYKIPVKVSGKNLMTPYAPTTKNGLTLDVNNDGTLHIYGTATADTVFKQEIYNVPPNTYFLSGCPSGGSNSTYRLLAYFRKFNYNLIDYGEGAKYKLNEESNVVFDLKVYAGQPVDIVFKPMLEKGDVRTDYEPYIEPITTNIYLDEPLRKIGNYADYIDFSTGKVKRVIKNLVFDGTEMWRKSSAAENRFLISIKESYLGNGLYAPDLLLCDRLIASKTRDVGYIDVSYTTGHANGVELVLGLTYSTLDEMVQYVKEQYNAGTPLYVNYVLYEPTEETIELPELKTFEDYTNVEVLTEVTPSKIEATYYGYTME